MHLASQYGHEDSDFETGVLSPHFQTLVAQLLVASQR